MRARKVIIGIHGLANKPPQKVLEAWWKKSLSEGLSRIDRDWPLYRFELVYWADLVHERSQDPDESDPDSKYFIKDPYLPAGDPVPDVKPSRLKKKLLGVLETKLDDIFFKKRGLINLDKVTDMLIRRLLKDLDIYYNRTIEFGARKGEPAKETIRSRLAEVLEKYRRRDIVLVAHSMGTIIAYDVLTQTLPQIEIDTLVTIGSPLGLPVIMKKILAEQGRPVRKGEEVRTPENIRGAWYNFADLLDPVALNYNLADDFAPNSRGIAPRDVQIRNDYSQGIGGHHKSYGYLRSPELSAVMAEFLESHRSRFSISLARRISKLLKKTKF